MNRWKIGFLIGVIFLSGGLLFWGQKGSIVWASEGGVYQAEVRADDEEIGEQMSVTPEEDEAADRVLMTEKIGWRKTSAYLAGVVVVGTLLGAIFQWVRQARSKRTD